MAVIDLYTIRPARVAAQQLGRLALAITTIGLCTPVAAADNAQPATAEQTASQAADNPYARLDWVPLKQLSPAQIKQLPASCCGAYISPYTPAAHAPPVAQTPIDARAKSSTSTGQNTIILQGDVELRQGPRLVKAQRATVHRDSNAIILDQHITLREKGLLIHAQHAQVERNRKNATLDNAEFVLHQSRIHGKAGKLQKFGDRLIRLSDGGFSTCAPGSNMWTLKASKLELHPQDHYGTAHNARLAIKGVPLLYIPYMYFPVGDKRQTGLLFPSLSEGSHNGFEYAQPFYWNIAPQMDAVITPRFMSKRGTLWQVDARHLSSFFTTEVQAGYLHDDQGGYDRSAEKAIASGEQTHAQAYPHEGHDRWMVHITQTGGNTSRLKTQLNYVDLSDTDYVLDLADSNSDTDTERQSQVAKVGEISYTTNDWKLGLGARETRYLNPSRQQPYRVLPRIYAEGNYQFDDWAVDLSNEFERFDLVPFYNRPTDKLVVGERLRTDYGISWDKSWQWGYFKPRIGVKTLNYRLQQAPVENTNNSAANAIYNDSPSLSTPQASIDTGLYFERMSHIGQYSFIQTLEPRLFYFYSGYTDHSALYSPLNSNNSVVKFDTQYIQFNYDQLFSRTHFTGGDRLDDANQLSAGVTSRFISPVTGVEQFSVSVGQLYRFTTPRVTLDPNHRLEEETYNHSGYAGRISARAGDSLQLTSDLLYDTNSHHLSSASANIEYHDTSNRLVSLSYRYQRHLVDDNDIPTDTSLDQVDFGAYIPVSHGWSVVARSNYDFTYKRELDTFAGLEYNDCCYRVRLLWRHWLNTDYSSASALADLTDDDYDRGVFIDIQLKGLASISDRVGRILRKTIPAYKDHQQNLR